MRPCDLGNVAMAGLSNLFVRIRPSLLYPILFNLGWDRIPFVPALRGAALRGSEDGFCEGRLRCLFFLFYFILFALESGTWSLVKY